MSSENTVTGRGGRIVVDGGTVLRIRNWSPTETRAGGSEWGDSDSEGYTNRSKGRKDCTFTAEGVYDTTASVLALLEVTDVVAVNLEGQAGHPGWNFPRAVVTDFSLTCDADTEEVTGWNASFGADGSWTRS